MAGSWTRKDLPLFLLVTVAKRVAFIRFFCDSLKEQNTSAVKGVNLFPVTSMSQTFGVTDQRPANCSRLAPVRAPAPCSSAFLSRPSLRLEPDELLGHLVSSALGQNAQDGVARVIEVYPAAQGTPAGAAAPLQRVTQLQHGDPQHTVRPAEAVILHAHL